VSSADDCVDGPSVDGSGVPESDGSVEVDGCGVEGSGAGLDGCGVKGSPVELDGEGVGVALVDGVAAVLGWGQSAFADGVPSTGIEPPEANESAGSLEMPHGSTTVPGVAVFVPKPEMGASVTLLLPNVVGFADGFPVRYGRGSVKPPWTMISKCR